MVASALNLPVYTRLLAKVHPTVPRTEEENDRLIGAVEELTERKLSPEEKELLELLLALIESFERSRYAPKKSAQPHDILREMMRAHDLKPKDLYGVFGSKGTTSEVLRGKRAISKAAAKTLAARFGIPADLLL